MRASPYPRSVLVMDAALIILFLGGARFAVRMYVESYRGQFATKNGLIVGAGQAGCDLAGR